VPRLPGLLAAEAAPDLRPRRLQPHRPRRLVLHRSAGGQPGRLDHAAVADEQLRSGDQLGAHLTRAATERARPTGPDSNCARRRHHRLVGSASSMIWWTQARPQLVGHDLDGGSGAAVLGGPGAMLEPVHDHHPAASAERLGHMLGLVAPHDHGEEGRLLLPPTRHRHPEHGPGDPSLGVSQFGVVGEVAGEAHGCLGHAGSLLLPGRAVCPALEPGDGGHRGRPPGHQGQATEPTKLAPPGQAAGAGRLGCRVGWRRSRLGVGHASTVRPAPSTLGVVGERGSRGESCFQLVPGALGEQRPRQRLREPITVPLRRPAALGDEHAVHRV
jgi:hypothetical protein